MSMWDDGIPPEIPHDHLYGIGWNPMNLVASVQKIEGVSSARRIGVDYMSPLFQQLLPMAAPDAQLVNAEALMRSVRMRKTADEVACITTAVAIAEAALTASVDNLRPGVNGKLLLAAFMARMTEFGITTPASEGTFRATVPASPGTTPAFPRLTTDERIDEGALVVVSGGVLYSGYEGSIARTWPCTDRPAALPIDPSATSTVGGTTSGSGCATRVVRARRAPICSTPTPRPGSPTPSSRSRPAWVSGPRGRSRGARSADRSTRPGASRRAW